MNKYIEIKEYKTNRVVKRINVTGKSSRFVDKIDHGLNVNLNHDKFYTLIRETKTKCKAF